MRSSFWSSVGWLVSAPNDVANYGSLQEPNMIAKHKYNANCIEYAFLKLDPKFVNAEQRTKAVDVLEGRAANKK